jgi:glycosyltransferase involved in cell wall biosynthesis
MTPLPSYVLITPARNEETHIERTLRCVVAQTHRPAHWVVVSDGSTDGTDEIVRRYVAEHSWIEHLRLPDHRDRSFAAKANCFNAGFERVRRKAFDVVGNLDADISFGPDYFEYLLGRFAQQPDLGVAGTPFYEDEEQPGEHSYAHEAANLSHVSGACQMFRRACFDDVGGYVPIKGGAIDWMAVTTARMKGWRTQTFVDRACRHHRKIGTANHGPLMARFHYGRKAYYVGGHPLWEFARGVFQMRRAPRVLGGLWFMAGFSWAAITRMPRPVSPELMAFHRHEQMTRLRQVLGWGSSKAARS